MDRVHYKVRGEGRILSRAAYVVLGVTTEGYKEILSITVGANETRKFWLGMLNDLKNRGLRDVLLFVSMGCPVLRKPSAQSNPRPRYRELPEKSSFIPEAGCGQSPQKSSS